MYQWPPQWQTVWTPYGAAVAIADQAAEEQTEEQSIGFCQYCRKFFCRIIVIQFCCILEVRSSIVRSKFIANGSDQ